MTIEEEIKAAIAKYLVQHKHGLNCRCIGEGASDHLYADILTIIGPIEKTFVVDPSFTPEHVDPNLVSYTP